MSMRDNSPEGQKNRQKLVNQALENWKKTAMTEKQLTPLAELIEFIDKEQGMFKDSFVLEIKRKAQSLLPKEKQGIIDSFCATGSKEVGFTKYNVILKEDGEDYFNETYKQLL